MSFYNTISAQGAPLIAYRTNSNKQEDRVLKILQANPVWWSPDAVLAMYNKIYAEVPITSIRRALTDLTESGSIEKSDTANAPGPYGKPTHQWRVKREEVGQKSLF